MATSAFKSTTKRSLIVGRGSAGSGGGDERLSSSSNKTAHRRSRSLSQFSHRVPSCLEESQAADYTAAPKGKFVNTVRGSDALPEISLDDLALEFFSSSSITNDEEERRESGERGRARSGRRGTGGSEIGRWAEETASSKRRGRSISRHGGGDGEIKNVISNGSGGKSKDLEASSRRRRSVSVLRHGNGSYKNVVSNGTAGKIVKSDVNSRRRRSLSVLRCQISDSESDADHFRGANYIEGKKIDKLNGQISLSQMTKASGGRLLRKSVSQKDLSRLHDGYSSHSSVLTDDETKDAYCRKNGNEKTIHAVNAQKRDEHPEDAINSGLHEAMRKEVRHAVKEIRSELERAVVRNEADFLSDNVLHSDEANALHVFSAIRKNYATKLEQSHKHKQDLRAEMMLEEQRGMELDKIVRDLLPYSNNTVAAQKHTRARKSSDRNRMSKELSEEAEKFLEDFLSNVEDTDMSSFDGDKSDASSTLGRAMKPKESTYVVMDAVQKPAGSDHAALGMDGVILPWLQWETTNDASLSSKNKGWTPVTAKSLQWSAEQDITLSQDPSAYSASSHGSWSPIMYNKGHSGISKEDEGKKCLDSGTCQWRSTVDLSENVVPQKEDVLFELFKERNRINSGGLLLCAHIF